MIARSLVLATLLITLWRANVYAESDGYMGYGLFLWHVDNGHIKRVTIGPYSRIAGTYLEEGQVRDFYTYAGSGPQDLCLLGKLKEKGVEIETKECPEKPFNPGWLYLAAQSGPWVLCSVIILLLLGMNRKINRLMRGNPTARLT